MEFKQTAFLNHISNVIPNYEKKQTEKEGNRIKTQNPELRNNAILGKSIENPMNKFNVKTVTNRKVT